MKRIFAVLLAIPVFSAFLIAQTPEWVERMNDPNADFYETVQLAEAYFDQVGTGKGTGWKVFKRWEYWAETHLDEDRTLRRWYATEDIMREYFASHPEMTNARRNSTNGSWNQLGPIVLPANGTGQPNGLGRTTAIAFHPTNANNIYVATPSGGFWYTTDYGNSWNESSVGFTRLGLSSIVLHPSTPNIIYAATGDRDGGDTPGYGVWRSTDNGATWNPHNTGMGNRTTYEILMHPTNSNIMLASTNDRVWRTVNGGANWTATYSGPEDFKDLAFHPTDPNIVYAAGNDFFRSTDNGQSWTQVTNGVPTGTQRIAIATSVASPNTVYLIAGDGGGLEGFYRSTNSGASFTQRSNTPNILGYGTTGGTGSQAWYDLVAIGDPGNSDHITIGGINIWETFDGGQTWSIVAHWTGGGGNPAIHADQHVLEYSPHTGHLWNGNDGGVYYTIDAGASWIDVSSDLAIAQVYKIGQSQQTRDLVINGYQDNGTGIYRGTGGWWTEIGGDGMECIIDYTDDNYMYGALYYGDIRRSTNAGNTFGGITGTISESGAWVTPYKLHPTDPNIMFVGMNNMWRSNNVKAGTPTFTQISTIAGGNTIRDIAIAPSDPNTIYITRSGSNNFYRSTNAMGGSPTWTNLDGNLPLGGTPTDIEIDPTDPTHVWITMGTNVYESFNSGGSWADISTNLPGITTRTLVYDQRSTNDALYVGSDLGVWYKDNANTNWVQFSNGLPNVEITELEIYYDPTCAGNDMLRAGTYGRGLWESDLRDPGNVPPIACLSGTPTEPCVGQVVTLSDESAYTPTSWAWTITPATFNYVNTTNGTSQNPQVEFTATGTYTITLTATNVNGSDVATQTNYINVTGSALTLPISEDFETATACATTNNCGATNCALPNGWINELNGTVDIHDWRIDAGGTPSSNTGPSVDFNPGTATGNYAYTEASGSCTSVEAHMVSPCVDLRTVSNPELTFAYHMFGASMGELHLDVQSAGVWTLDVMTVLSGDLGNSWQTRTVNLAAFVGNVVRIRFRGRTGTGFASDMAIDDISIVESPILNGEWISLLGEFVPQAGNEISWEPAGDEDATEWILEKQMEANQFAELDRFSVVPGKAHYEHLDEQPFNGLNVYRLRMLDQNGQIQDAGQVEVMSIWDGESVNVFPNPHNGQLNLKVQATRSETVTVRIFDLMGKEVYQQPISVREGLEIHRFDLSRLDAGVYFFRYKDQSVKVVQL
ncbi:MAG: T9SS type A sorting domain-containing protein [Bacteroidota bacterium]